MLGLKQKNGEGPAKYARRARRISEHIDPTYDSLLALKFQDGFKCRRLQVYLSIDSESPARFAFEVVYKRFLTFNKINQRKQKKKERSDPFGSSESESGSESESESDTDVPKKKKRGTLAAAEYDSDESLSSSDDEPVKRKKKNKRTNRKDPYKAIEELKELLTAKSSSESTAIDLRTVKNQLPSFLSTHSERLLLQSQKTRSRSPLMS